MRSALLLVTCLLGVAGCAAHRPATQAPPAATDAPLRFAWPHPAQGVVTERVLKKDSQVTMRYDVSLRQRPTGDAYELRIENLKFLEIDGQDFSQGPLPAELEQVQALTGAIPVLLISPEGRFAGTVGFDETIERVLEYLGEEGQRPEVRELFADPKIRASLEQKGAEFWRVWVGAWVGHKLAPGQKLSLLTPVSLPDGEAYEAPVQLEHLGEETTHPGAIRLVMKTVMEGEPLRRSTVALMSRMVQSSDTVVTVPDFEKMLESARKESSLEVVTDPATLRPLRARLEQTNTLTFKGEGTLTEREEHTYEFSWHDGG